MPFCDSQTVTVLLIVVLIYALSPIDAISDRTHGRRHFDDLFLVFLLALGITVFMENCPGYYYHY